MRPLKDHLKEKIALLRLKQGDTEAFGFIYETYADRIFRYVSFKVADRGMAHDIVQEVFLQTWEYIMENKAVEKLQPLLYRIAHRKVVDFYRARERQAALIEDMHESAQRAGAADQVGVELHFLKKQLIRLKPEYQDIIVLKHMEGLSIAEIASILEKDANNIRVTLHRALEALKKIIEEAEDQKKN